MSCWLAIRAIEAAVIGTAVCLTGPLLASRGAELGMEFGLMWGWWFTVMETGRRIRLTGAG